MIMATRPVHRLQPVRGDPVDVKNAAPKNRRALGDIGNIASLPGVDGGKINRPVTRNFRAQILENAHDVAAAKKKEINSDKPSVLDGAQAVTKKQEIVRAVQKKAKAVKPEPSKRVEVIEISPDTNEVVKAKECQKKDAAMASMTKLTYSMVLKARSRAASETWDIDSVDKDNDLAAVEYVEDMYAFYKEAENESKPQLYMHKQPEINEKMRSILIDWLVEVHIKFDLSPETLYLTINIIDRFLSLKTIARRELQLLGVSSLLIASKYEEIWPPQVNDLVYVTDNSYSNEQILVMEKTVLGNLEWYLTVPTQHVFLVRFIKAAISDPEVEYMVHFLAELGMMHHETLKFSPSLLAASAVYTARSFLSKIPAWTSTLVFHTGYAACQIMGCARLLTSIHSKAGASKLRGVVKKYSKPERCAVALVSPAIDSYKKSLKENPAF